MFLFLIYWRINEGVVMVSNLIKIIKLGFYLFFFDVKVFVVIMIRI